MIRIRCEAWQREGMNESWRDRDGGGGRGEVADGRDGTGWERKRKEGWGGVWSEAGGVQKSAALIINVLNSLVMPQK